MLGGKHRIWTNGGWLACGRSCFIWVGARRRGMRERLPACLFYVAHPGPQPTDPFILRSCYPRVLGLQKNPR